MTVAKSDTDMALDLARLAQLFLSYGKHGAADKLLNAAVELDRANPAVTRVRAFTAYKCGRYAEAVELARAARAAGSGDAPATSGAPRQTAAGLAAMSLSLVEAFSLMSLGRAGEAGERYASLSAPTDRAALADGAEPTQSDTAFATRPVGRMNTTE
jgi:tetratricopeptide (TPR) repeat protein